jgi:hypothetical protein
MTNIHPALGYSFEDLHAALMERVNSGSINMVRSGTLALFNYSKDCQFAHQWDTFTMMARGLILDTSYNNKSIVALSFPKFFNASEQEGASVVKFDAPFDAYTKMDGCAHEDTIVQTNIGPKTIRELCETQPNCLALTFNVETQKFEYNQIEGYFTQENNDDWYELTLEDGTSVKLTGNHKIWIPALFCYRRVDQLNGDEEFLLLQK